MKDYRVIFKRIGSVVLGLMTLIIFDDMSDPMTGFGDGVFGVLTPLAVGLVAASFLLFGLAPILETLVIKAGKPRLARAIRPTVIWLTYLARAKISGSARLYITQ